ncbi:MAG: hypothetical protein HN726_02660 [Candidatus Magasanikbacteria bacterium]|jgi:hypothetical protein|nr:hypothetical protein [Candidatus Magasanikbacteria bacterium]MBT4221308.1 hypothetical protein [Candidatus Magasanikbacteria bacterium]MBT4350844.1 hypothetical protein [Candidatus Magasanikbacteria bacterium]MBT4542156.1 hypothetical protein [Candidatus Magasanikbacteria bacterium]MBT6253432.1 hypothetical protein [Candidatus Magasanikbacteria bacterium]
MELHPKQKKEHASPKDFFLHLLMIITLYGSAISIIIIVFQIINIYLPDTLYNTNNYGGVDRYKDTLRGALATLIVMFPVYIVTMKHLKKMYIQMPGKLNLTIRKWLIYFTLFVGSIITIIDLISILNNLLSGELTVRFTLKVLTVLVVVGTILWYYLLEIKKNK